MSNNLAPDIERCACTMLGEHLRRGNCRNETVIGFVEKVIGDPGEIGPDEVRAIREKALVELDESANSTYEDEDMVTVRYLIYSELCDRAALDLAVNIVHFRWDGQKPGDQTVNLGFGTSLAITTSLAANVVEFHFAVVGAWHTADHQARLGGRR